jgi:hypothetical protein
MRAMKRFSMPLTLVSALAACSSSTPNISSDQACQDLATALCNLEDNCSAGYTLAKNWGGLSTCQNLEMQNCLLSLSAPSTSRTPDKVEACAQAYPSTSCGDFYATVLPSACVPAPGGLANGAACVASGQCQSTFCAVPNDGTVCGTCQPLPPAGASCATVGCGRGTVCGRSGICDAPVQDGGSCTDPDQCFFDLLCQGLDAGGMAGACLPAVSKVGASCDYQGLGAPLCSNRLGLQCQGPLKTCVPTILADAGEACGEIDAGPKPCPDGEATCIVIEQIQCVGGGDCVESAGSASCLAGALPGQACDLGAGPSCITPAKCVVDAGTSGMCALPNASLCGGQ